MNFWMYISNEILDLENDFAEIFKVNGFYRDYENVWEWIEGNSFWLNLKINISRKHNWIQGEYEEPLRIRIDYKIPDLNNENIINEIGQALLYKFNVEIFYGEINYVKGTDFEYVSQKTFKD